MLWLALGLQLAPAQGVCPGREDALAALEDAVITLDLAVVPDRFDDAIAAFDCGYVAQPEELARLWLAEGTWLHLEKDEDAALESFRAARRVAPDVYTEAFGPKIRAIWESAAQPSGTGTLRIDPALTWWTVWVDGRPTKPGELPVGLHVVQGGPAADDIRFGKLVVMRDNTTAVALHEEQEGPAPAAPVVEVDRSREPPRFTAQTAVGIGAALSIGDGVAGLVPASLEASGIGRLPVRTDGPRSMWVRAGVSAVPSLVGPWAFDGEQGPAEVPTALGVHLAAGGRNVQGDVGALVGWQWPGRGVVRLLADLEVSEVLAVEPRVGLNVGRGAEPALEVLIAYRPPVVH